MIYERIQRYSEEYQTKEKIQSNQLIEYNQALKQRGSIILWVPDDIEEQWYVERGRETYSDAAIDIVASLKVVYGQPWRQTEGLVRSIFEAADIALEVPDFSTLSRRAGNVNCRVRVSGSKNKVRLILDSSGAKITGEGGWKTKKLGPSKHRRWKKIHIGIDADGEVVSVEVTDNDIHNAEVLRDVLEKVLEDISSFFGDGAYDHRVVYEALREYGVEAVCIPPRKDAKIWVHGNATGLPHPRDENLRAIRRSTRRVWKKHSGYCIRSLSENTMYRFKQPLAAVLHHESTKTNMPRLEQNAVC